MSDMFKSYIEAIVINRSFDLFIECIVVLLPQVLADFPHTAAELKVEYLLDLFPEMQPRSFSIASSLQVAHHS